MDKFEKIEMHLQSIDKTLVKNTTILDEHVRRTGLLEEAIRPLQSQHDMIRGAVKLFVILSGSAAIAILVERVLR